MHTKVCWMSEKGEIPPLDVSKLARIAKAKPLPKPKGLWTLKNYRILVTIRAPLHMS